MKVGTNLSTFEKCNGLYLTYFSTRPSEGKYYAIDVFIIVLNILLSIIGSAANGTIIAAYFRNQRLRCQHTMLMCFLSCTNFTVTAILQPLFIITRFGNLFAINHCAVWSINSLLSFICLSVSLLCLVFISLERFAILRYAFRYKLIVTHRRIKLALCSAWFLVLLVAVLHITIAVKEVTFIFYAVLSLFSVVICISVLVSTEQQLRRHRSSIRHNQTANMSKAQMKAQKKIVYSTRTAFALGAILLACYLPGMLMLTYEGFFEQTKPDYFLIVRPCVITLMYVNSALDPCMVLWRNQEIRTTATHIFDRTKWVGSPSTTEEPTRRTKLRASGSSYGKESRVFDGSADQNVRLKTSQN